MGHSKFVYVTIIRATCEQIWDAPLAGSEKWPEGL